MWPLKKIGLNNPFQISMSPGYQQLIDYWRGKGEKPSADAAFKALMQLTENVKAENAFAHSDYIDALFRQQNTDQTKSNKGKVIDTKGVIFAADYDLGRNGYAYYDKDTADFHVSTNKSGQGNIGGVYRNDGVDIIPCTDDVSNGYSVTSIQTDEWMKYTINVKTKGNYNLNMRISSDNADSKVSMLVNNKPVGGGFSLPNSGSLVKWQTVRLQNINLVKGLNTIIIKADNGGFNFNYFELIKGK
jgi:hypothetical protein